MRPPDAADTRATTARGRPSRESRVHDMPEQQTCCVHCHEEFRAADVYVRCPICRCDLRITTCSTVGAADSQHLAAL